jgi:hypothetical protein
VWCKCFEKVERLIPTQEILSILAKKSLLLFLSYILAIYFFKTPISHSILAIHFPYSIYLLFLKDFFVLSLLGGDRMIGFFFFFCYIWSIHGLFSNGLIDHENLISCLYPFILVLILLCLPE